MGYPGIVTLEFKKLLFIIIRKTIQSSLFQPFIYRFI